MMNLRSLSIGKNHQILPLYELRKTKLFTKVILPIFDFTLATKIDYIPWKVQVKFLRDLSWVFNSRIIQEKSLINLFLAINKVIKPQIFCDIGANIGFYSWLLVAQNSDLQAILFEPDPDNIRLLQKTIKQSKLTKVDIIPCAVSNQIGQANFAVDKITGATGSLETEKETFIKRQYGAKDRDLISVNTFTLDYLIEKKTISCPDFIKIDVEGSENKVFLGANSLLSNYQPIIIFECSQDNKKSLLNYLQDLGYLTFDANKINGNVWQAANILAIPPRYHSCIDAIFTAWSAEKN